MLSESSLAVVGTLLYSIKFDELDDALADRRAQALIEEPLGEFTVDEERRALAEALASNSTLSKTIEISELVSTAPSETEFRDYLQRVVDRMDSRRPWATPPHRELSHVRWPSEYANANAVGRIKLNYVRAQEKLNYGFLPVEDSDISRNILILRLRSGDEIALVTPWWPDSMDVAVLSRDPGRPPSEVVAALLDGTRFTPDEVEPVPPGSDD